MRLCNLVTTDHGRTLVPPGLYQFLISNVVTPVVPVASKLQVPKTLQSSSIVGGKIGVATATQESLTLTAPYNLDLATSSIILAIRFDTPSIGDNLNFRYQYNASLGISCDIGPTDIYTAINGETGVGSVTNALSGAGEHTLVIAWDGTTGNLYQYLDGGAAQSANIPLTDSLKGWGTLQVGDNVGLNSANLFFRDFHVITFLNKPLPNMSAFVATYNSAPQLTKMSSFGA